MNANGIAAMLFGWWAISQVLLGDALDRLGVFGGGATDKAQGKDSGSGGSIIPNIPLVPQGPVTGLPFSPIAYRNNQRSTT